MHRQEVCGDCFKIVRQCRCPGPHDRVLVTCDTCRIRKSLQKATTAPEQLRETLTIAESVLYEEHPHDTRLYKLAKHVYDTLKYLKEVK